jgi:hypothetical protein
MTCPETLSIGAYVLGALEIEDRRTVERHLSSCATCRATLLQFAHLPGLLHGVPLEDIESWNDAPPESLSLAEIHDSATAARKRRRWGRALAGVAGVVAFGVVGVVAWQELTPQTTTWSATNGVGGIDTTAKLTGRDWGTDIQLQMTDLQPDEHCMLIVHSRDGSTETAGWWAANGSYQAKVPASTSIPLRDIERLEVVTSGDTVLSTVSPTTH